MISYPELGLYYIRNKDSPDHFYMINKEPVIRFPVDILPVSFYWWSPNQDIFSWWQCGIYLIWCTMGCWRFMTCSITTKKWDSSRLNSDLLPVLIFFCTFKMAVQWKDRNNERPINPGDRLRSSEKFHQMCN